ncbi:hypothetical protein AB0L82_34100 [Nocardia sp. NPDC052001]|uniref:hypothetical protein n=1 Tax=Nocardia sp. NPDC052001 TaxID=3154853 RepID=UPI00341434A9
MIDPKDGVSVAICFELLINFGDDVDAARSAVLACTRHGSQTLTAGDQRIPFHTPVPRMVGTHCELSVVPVGVGYGVVSDGPRIALTAAELTDLGNSLYSLLATFDGYIAAQVGWNPDDFVDPAELANEYLDELRDGALDGLVLSDALHAEFGLGENYAVFRPGYRWIPWRGQQPSSLTSD